MKSIRLALILSFLFPVLFLAFSPQALADVSHTSNTNTLSEGFLCSGISSGNFQSYQYLGQGLSGNLSEVDIKLLNPGPVNYGKRVSISIFESDTHLDTFNDILALNPVWQQGFSFATGFNINSYDGIVTFNNPDFGSDYNFLPNKHYYLVPRFFTSDSGGICQSTYFYGNLDSNSYPTGEFYSDPYVKDIYFDLKGLSHSSTTPSGNSNVLFIPGLEASRLYEKKTILGVSVEDQLWEPNTFGEVDDLYLDNNGNSINQNIYTKDIIDNTLTFDVYKSLITELNNLESTDKINDWRAYAYDWRQGIGDLIQNGTKYNNDQVLSLIGTLQSLVNTSKNGEVTIITHSNGGLIAKALIKKLQDMKFLGQSDLVDHVDTLVLVASPQLGTPDAFSAILHGYKQSLPFKLMSESQARKLGRNMSSAYGLLPSRKYFDQINIRPLGVFASTSDQIYQNTYGSNIDSYTEEQNFILGLEGRVEPSETDLISPIIGNNLLLSQAENLHDSIDNMIFPPSIEVISIAGWGKETIGGIKYARTDLEPVFTMRGDHTVVSSSALYGQGTKYWLDLTNSKIDHKNILEDPQLLSFINHVIDKETPQLPLVLSMITDTEPFQIGDRLHLGVHSPVSIGVYDSLGNFTGKICDDVTGNCNIQENIPGSTYYEFGEGKYINLGKGNLQRAVLQGTGIGTFTFNSEVVSPNETSVVSSFVDIPVTTQTQAEVTLNATGTPQLKLDVTGDGVFDFTLAPSGTFDPIIYLQIMKETVNSLEITDAKKKAFSNRVDNIIKSIQKGKIDKAKLTADKFKSVLEKKISKPDPKHPRIKKLSKTDAQLLLDMLNNLLDNLG